MNRVRSFKLTNSQGVFAGITMFVSLLPLLVARMLKIPLVALDNFTDAVFYLAYARHFGELILRYGFPYYATRFGGILPDALSGQFFGEIEGIWVLRYTLSALVSVGLFLFFRKRYGVLAGVLASLLWCFNPAALRLLCTTYVDSTAVPFLILGCCLFASGLGGGFAALLAGILLALAASAHLYAAFALVLLTPYSFGALWDNRPVLLKSFRWMLGGFVVTFVAGWLWYWIVWGMPALFSPTLEVMHDLGSGQTALWKKPLMVALRETPAWFGPLILLIPTALASFRGGLLIRGAAFSLLMSAGFFWGGDLLGNAYVLSMPFYYSFLLPVTIFAGATLCGEVLSVQENIFPKWAIVLSLLLEVIAPPLVAASGTLSLWKILVMGLLPLLLLAGAWLKIKRRILVVLSVLGLGFSSGMVAFTGMFSQFLGHYPRNDIPVLEIAFALQRELPKAADDGGVMRFWYNDDLRKPGGADLRMIQSFWLHPFGKLIGVLDGYIPFPVMSESDAASISRSGVDRIVVMNQDPGQVDKGLDEIRKKRLPFELSKRSTLAALSEASRKIEIAILERLQKTAPPSVSHYDLHCIQALNRGRISWNGKDAELSSGTIKGWSFATLPLGVLKKGKSIHFCFRIEKGNIRFALNDEKVHFFEHVEKWPIQGEEEVVLTAPQDLSDAFVSFHSMYPSGSESRLVIKEVFEDADSDELNKSGTTP